jgi:hypothetical protein
MRGGVVAALVFLAVLVTVPSAGAKGRPITPALSMTVSATPHAARAHGVRLTLTLRYEMQCDYPGAGPLVVTFPSALTLPQQFPAGAVEWGQKPLAAQVDGQRVTVTIPRHKGVLCDLMGPGSLTLTFTPTAKLANPARAGSYGFTATHARRTFTAKLAVKPAA